MAVRRLLTLKPHVSLFLQVKRLYRLEQFLKKSQSPQDAAVFKKAITRASVAFADADKLARALHASLRVLNKWKTGGALPPPVKRETILNELLGETKELRKQLQRRLIVPKRR